ncbi:MAG TPA: hypothetical protein VM118_14530, partial [Acidobacteriota bacterium]|nr:hypothetical protein [Acidobacteriota bacterium]
MSSDMYEVPPKEHVLCLTIDMFKSTEAGLELTEEEFDGFNYALVRQFSPHLEAVGLESATVKFTGDGWLVFGVGPRSASRLCCLALIMSRRFRDDMTQTTTPPIDEIPPLRLSISSGYDLRVTLPDGRADWVGDSARRAVRISQVCDPNEILVDESVRSLVHRNFNFSGVNLPQRVAEGNIKKDEEPLVAHRLDDLNVRAATQAEAPEYYVNTLNLIGQREDAATLTETVATRLVAAAHASDEDRAISERQLNGIMSRITDHKTVRHLFQSVVDSGVTPDVHAYSILIHKAPDYEAALRWYEEMEGRAIAPNVVTFSTLVAKAPDYEAALRWYEEMEGRAIAPNVVTFSTLVAKAPDYEAALRWFEVME